MKANSIYRLLGPKHCMPLFGRVGIQEVVVNVLPQLCNLRPPVLYPEHIADHPCYYEWKRTHSKERLDRDREFRTRCTPNHTRLRKRMTEKIKVSTHTQCIHKSKISSSQMWGPHEIPSRCTDTVDR